MPKVNITEQFKNEFNRLRRSLSPGLFRFVVVQYNHYEWVRQTQAFLRRIFPERSFGTINLQQADYHTLTEGIYTQGKGILFLEHFDEILNETHKTYQGFNQRRDKIAAHPIALVCFIPAHLAPRRLADKMPDFYSFRHLIIELNAPMPQCPKTKTKPSSCKAASLTA